MTAIPDLELTRMRISDLVPNDANPRKITPAKLAQLRDRLKRFGHAGVFVWNRRLGRLVGGHQRALALQALGVQEVDVKVGDWDEAEDHVLSVALNTHDGAWDHDKLGDLLAGVRDADPTLLSHTGLGADKITMMLEGVGRSMKDRGAGDLPDPDRIQKPRTPVSKRGDVWILGAHRVMCGDATSPADVERLMAGQRADLVHTDPPYGVNYQPGKRQGAAVTHTVQNDELKGDALLHLLDGSLRLMCQHSTEAAAFYIWHADDTADDFRDAMKRVGLQKRQTLLWVKPSPAPNRSDYQYQHEPCYYAAKDGATPTFYGDRTNMTVWTLSATTDQGALATVLGKGLHVVDGHGNGIYLEARPPAGKKPRRVRLTEGRPLLLDDQAAGTVWFVQRDRGAVHPTKKPVALCGKPIQNSSKAGGLVFDPFAGEGSTLFAAELLGRRCYTMDLDAGWVDVIVRTWEKQTGQKATLEAPHA